MATRKLAEAEAAVREAAINIDPLVRLGEPKPIGWYAAQLDELSDDLFSERCAGALPPLRSLPAVPYLSTGRHAPSSLPTPSCLSPCASRTAGLLSLSPQASRMCGLPPTPHTPPCTLPFHPPSLPFIPPPPPPPLGSATLYAEYGVALQDGLKEISRHLRAARLLACGQVLRPVEKLITKACLSPRDEGEREWLTTVRALLNELRTLSAEVQDALREFGDWRRAGWKAAGESGGLRTEWRAGDDASLWVRIEGELSGAELPHTAAVAHETELWPRWLPFCTAAETLKAVSPTEQITYVQFDLTSMMRRGALIHWSLSDSLVERQSLLLLGASLGDTSPIVPPPSAAGVTIADVRAIKVLIRPRSPTSARLECVCNVDLKATIPQQVRGGAGPRRDMPGHVGACQTTSGHVGPYWGTWGDAGARRGMSEHVGAATPTVPSPAPPSCRRCSPFTPRPYASPSRRAPRPAVRAPGPIAHTRHVWGVSLPRRNHSSWCKSLSRRCLVPSHCSWCARRSVRAQAQPRRRVLATPWARTTRTLGRWLRAAASTHAWTASCSATLSSLARGRRGTRPRAELAAPRTRAPVQSACAERVVGMVAGRKAYGQRWMPPVPLCQWHDASASCPRRTRRGGHRLYTQAHALCWSRNTGAQHARPCGQSELRGNPCGASWQAGYTGQLGCTVPSGSPPVELYRGTGTAPGAYTPAQHAQL